MSKTILPFSDEMQSLSQVIGAGKINGNAQCNIQLRCGVVQGKGLRIRVSLASMPDHQAAIWISATAWKNCQPTLLGAANPDDLAPELTALILRYALQPLSEAWPELSISADTPTAYTLPATWSLIATITQQEYTLECALLAWPPLFIQQQLPHWESCPTPQQTPNALFYILLGWCHLSLSTLKQIQTGAGLTIRGIRTYSETECWLWQPHGPLIAVTFNQNQNVGDYKEYNMSIEHLLPDSETYWSENTAPKTDILSEENHNHTDLNESIPQLHAPLDLNTISHTVVLEIGRVEMSVSELSELNIGQILPCQPLLSDHITLRLNGHILGYGTLVEGTDGLLVRIESWRVVE
ncbi:MAG: FliM/FliN family flagellar motor switch protein [Plesiomonas sp.]|uniref:FliM/FliN family flagellar motor switch protein n=1 Tax=Plesiomonas sp. TaxID=2486279 RepID=UPI003F37E3A7